MNNITHRTCKHCNETKELSLLHSTTVRGKIHYRPCCRQCWNKIRRERKKNPLNNPHKTGLKTCKKCGIEKSTTHFSRTKNNHIYTFCKPCHTQASTERWSSMSYKHRKQLRKRICSTYYQNNSEKIKFKNSEWRKNNPESHAESQAKRRARLQGVITEKIDRSIIFIRDKHTCYLCLKVLTKHQITLDHLHSLKNGGSHTYENLKVACRPCNSKKGSRSLSELTIDEFPNCKLLLLIIIP